MTRRAPLLLPVATVLLVVIPTMFFSDNLHSLAESTSFDRLMLGLRWLEPAEGTSRWDPNFPLGTALLMAVPHALGLEPVLWGRGLSLACGLGSCALVFWLVRRAAGEWAAGLAAAGMWFVPAVTRGAVVTGEEALYLLAFLGALAALVLAVDEPERRGRWMVAAAAAANATVLVRLDAMTVVPLFGVLGVWLLGVRRGVLLGAVCFASTVTHLVVAWRMTGDPIGFARVASMNIHQNADGFDFLGPAVLPLNVASEVGWATSALAMFGAWWLWRERSESPVRGALGAALVWLFVVDFGLTVVGAMEARTMRYLVPLLVLAVAGAAVGATREGRPGAQRWVLPALFLFSLGSHFPTIVRQAQEERLPVGLVEMARWLGEQRGDDRPVVVGEQHPVFVVAGGLDHAATGVLPPGAPGDNRGDVVREVLERTGAGWIVRVEGNPTADAISAGAPGVTEAHRTVCCTVWRLPDQGD